MQNKYFQLMEDRPELFECFGPTKIITDKHLIKKFEKETEKKVGVIFESKNNLIVVDLVQEGIETYVFRERIIPLISSAIYVPKYQDQYILVEKFNKASRKFEYCFPRRFISPGCSIEENARNVLGFVHDIKYLGTVNPDADLIQNSVNLYLCEVFEIKIEGAKFVNLDELKYLIQSGEITDGNTIAGIMQLLIKE